MFFSTTGTTMLFISCFLVIFALWTGVSSVQVDYYWSDYDGHIPEDAVVGGQSFGHNVYIGQAYIKNEGVIPVQINPGTNEVAVPIKGVKRVDSHIKILCGPSGGFEWIPANSTNLHYVLLDKNLVLGGHEDNLGYIYVGRAMIGKSIQIGKVNAFDINNPRFHYTEKNNEKGLSQFEVLVFSNYVTALHVHRVTVKPKN